ncbi:MAG: MOSC domain-containing protein [Thiomicrorhabdus sp.]|nr:MOSC domain-containing protein [Thiomicrorhabdus sp.]
MQLISVNIGQIKTHPWRNGTPSALHKFAAQEPVFIDTLGLSGDEQADRKNHGGADKAVFLLPAAHYKRFEIQQPFGFLGENLTLEGIDETQVFLGDHFQIGDVRLEVTQPRSPCWKLGEYASIQANWSMPNFLQAYSKEGYVGFYCRVLSTGTVQTEQTITHVPYKGNHETLTIQELFLAKQLHKTNQHRQHLKIALQHPALSDAWKTSIQNILSLHQ